MLVTNPGKPLCFAQISSTNFFKLLIAESKTIPAILGSLSACISAVIAPIDRPHNPIYETSPVFLKYSITLSTSSLSYQPYFIYIYN